MNERHERLYPITIAELESWRAANRVTHDEARKRFAQFVVLECIAGAPWGARLAFKGGNALRFIYQNPRSTIDLDFTASDAFPDNDAAIRSILTAAMAGGLTKFDLKLMVQRIRRNPPGQRATMPTYDITVGYQFPGDRYFHDNDPSRRPWNTIVALEISLNDVVCETRPARLDPKLELDIRVCTLEDILAEKLRALLQQRKRRRNRRQDVYDIAHMVLRFGNKIDKAKLGRYFIRKCEARGIEARRSAFDGDIRDRAAFDYETLFDILDPNFIPFEVAWQTITRLLRDLDIPD